MNVIAVEILSQFVEVAPTLVREFILNEIESKSSVSNLNNSINLTKNSNAISFKSSSSSSSFASIKDDLSSSTVISSSSLLVSASQSVTPPPPPPLSNTQMNTPSQNRAPLSLEEILNTDDVFEPVLINYVIRQMINDPDQELSGAMQIVNLLKLLIDPENMLSAANVVKIFFIIFSYII